MAVTRYYNPETDSWELIGVGVQGPRGGPGDPGPEGDPGPPGTQIYYTQDPPAGANLGDMWIDRNGFQPVERVQQGLLSERPAAEPAIINMLFWATDEEQMYYCDGTAWQEVDPDVTESKLSGTTSGVLDDLVALDGAGGFKTVASGAYVTQADVDQAVDNATEPLRTSPVERSGKDGDGIFTVVEYHRQDGTRWKRSELTGSGPEYPQREVTIYESDGTTVESSVTYDLTYDGDGDLTGEAVQT